MGNNNELRGQVTIKLGPKERRLMFNFNTIRIMIERIRLVKNDPTFDMGSIEQFGLTDSHNFFAEIVFAALVNEADFNEEKFETPFETVASWVGAIYHDEEIKDKIYSAYIHALGLKKEEADAMIQARMETMDNVKK